MVGLVFLWDEDILCPVRGDRGETVKITGCPVYQDMGFPVFGRMFVVLDGR